MLQYNKNYRVLLPECLDFISDIEPKIKNYHPDKLAFILSRIIKVPIHNKEAISEAGFVSLSASILQKYVHDYKAYLMYAEDTGIIESDNHYIPGKKCIGYRFKQEVQKPKIYEIQKNSLVKAVNKYRVPPKDYDYLNKWFEGLKINYNSSCEFIEKEKKGVFEKSYYRAHQSAYDIDKHQYSLSVDRNIFRYHSNLTGLNKELRNFCSYDGHQLVSIDLKNSQPFFSTALFKGSSNFIKYIINISSNNSTSKFPIPSLMLVKVKEVAENEDVKRYIELVEKGVLYEYIEEQFLKKGIQFKTRKEIKSTVFQVLYSGNQFYGQKEAEPKRIFKELFPNVYTLFKYLKKGNKALLALMLQRMESYCILKVICHRIAQERPHLPIFTIHDSIATIKGEEDYIRQVIEEETSKIIGIKPQLNIEPWEA